MSYYNAANSHRGNVVVYDSNIPMKFNTFYIVDDKTDYMARL